MQQLTEIKALKEGWHGDAPLIPLHVCNIAEGVLRALETNMHPTVGASDDASIDLGWHSQDLWVTLDAEGVVYNNGTGGHTQFVTWQTETSELHCVQQLTEVLRSLLLCPD